MAINWLRNEQGNIAVPGAIALVAIIAVSGSGMDMMMVSNQTSSLQQLADNAALSAVREMALVANDAERLQAVAAAYVDAGAGSQNIIVASMVDLPNRTITVDLSSPPRTFFPGPMSQKEKIEVSATAQLSGEAGNICLIGLSDGVKRTISMTNEARLTARGCAIYSNSTDKQSMYVHGRAAVTADQVFLSGGFKGSATKLLKEPVTDVPPITDPLAGHPTPPVANCDHEDLVVTHIKSLSHGVYCGGLTIDGGKAKLFPGTYIIKDGPLTVTNGGILDGDNVGFYLTGENAKIDFDYDSSISLSAPKAGTLVGLLFYADPLNVMASKEKAGKKLKKGHVIRSDDARRLVGTIYLPDDRLIVDGNEPVADKSEYTVIVAKAFELNNGPNLVLQTDYHLSDIPVPDGVGPITDASSRLIN